MTPPAAEEFHISPHVSMRFFCAQKQTNKIVNKNKMKEKQAWEKKCIHYNRQIVGKKYSRKIHEKSVDKEKQIDYNQANGLSN